MYYYGARYYNPRESVWLSADPLSGYNPNNESEHYIDGQHNGGVYNSFNLNTYGYCYQNPVLLVDPNGKQAIAGAEIGAFTEYASIIGERMLFENMSFSEANKNIGWGDIGNISIAAGVVSISGMAKFAKWAGSSKGKKILVKIFDLGLDSIEDILKQYVKDDNIDLKQTLISTLTGLGMGKILNGTSLQKYIKKQDEIINKAESKISKIEAGKGNATGKFKRIRTQEAIINKAQKEKEFYGGINDVVTKTVTAGASTVTTGTYSNNKKKE